MSINNKHEIENKVAVFCCDNSNTNFGGVKMRGTNVYSRLKEYIGINIKVGKSNGCSSHIVHNTIQHAVDGLPAEIETIVLKIASLLIINDLVWAEESESEEESEDIEEDSSSDQREDDEDGSPQKFNNPKEETENSKPESHNPEKQIDIFSYHPPGVSAAVPHFHPIHSPRRGDDSFSYHKLNGPLSKNVQQYLVPNSNQLQAGSQSIDYRGQPDYSFAYGVHDGLSKNSHTHMESRDGNDLHGEYRVLQPDGLVRIVRYVQDPKEGFKMTVTYSKL
ncbi:uncharacterized protein LOC126890125 [Diabrotica virgifera virgifera]|uniref:Pro-resilin-like n=1 Tax=Diabrotica virgifera virgifera TaxID=50390 RepID=A0ABM5KXL3_DIAVI|nr:uncharacterized protein LOC126890125 [Diabrotica virgifera virgifera]